MAGPNDPFVPVPPAQTGPWTLPHMARPQPAAAPGPGNWLTAGLASGTHEALGRMFSDAVTGAPIGGAQHLAVTGISQGAFGNPSSLLPANAIASNVVPDALGVGSLALRMAPQLAMGMR